MTDLQRRALLGLVLGLVGIIGTLSHWPGLVIMVVGVLVALLLISLTKPRPERPL
jgi:uncharacterized membrane protein YccC